jgi:hypothetical protein
VEIDVVTLPGSYVLASPARVAVGTPSINAPPPTGFEIKLRPQAVKPVRKMLEQEIHVNTPGAPPPMEDGDMPAFRP